MGDASAPAPGAPLTLDQMVPGMVAELRRSFSLHDLQAFGALAPDHAPVHRDAAFARKQGYRDVLVFGFLVAAPFSGILGDRLPGPLTVLHTLRFGMVGPVYVGEEISYRAEVKQVSRATGAVIIDLVASRADSGEVVLRGQAQCGFRAQT